MTPKRVIAALAIAAHACAFTLAAQPAGAARSSEGLSPDGYRYSAIVSPAKPGVGDLAVVELSLEGVSAASALVSEINLDPGLKLEAESIRPGGGSGSTAPRADFRFELRVLAPGPLKIASISIAAEGKRIGIGPIVVRPADAPVGGGAGAWRWALPEEVYRYEAFELRLEPLGVGGEGGTSGSPLPVASFSLPVGASVEASGELSWTVIAFEEGDLLIPEATLSSPSSGGKAKAAKVRVKPLPSALKDSRALGRFTLSLAEGAGAATVAGATAVAGVPLRLSLVLEGRGNLPALVLPEPAIRLNGSLMLRSLWTTSRIDEARPEGGSYAGKSSLRLEIVPPREGNLSISFPPLAVLDSSSVQAVTNLLEVPTREIKVRKGAVAAASPPQATLVWGPSLAEPSAAWARGERGRALALLYGELRRAPPLSSAARDARKAASACSFLLGTSAPLHDALPPPRYFNFAAILVASAALSLFIAARIRGRRRRAARGGLLLVLALALAGSALAGAGLAAAAERREKYAVIWADSLRAVPSVRSELSVSVIRGSTARLLGMTGPYAGLVLADGVEGWVPIDSLYWY